MIGEGDAIEVQIVAMPGEGDAGGAGVGIGGGEATADGGGGDSAFRAEDNDGVIGRSADDLNVAGTGGQFRFANDYGRGEVDSDAFAEILGDGGRAEDDGGGADGGEFVHGNSPEFS